ncbi:MAG TPA: hypothetical protein VFB21_23200 [Chthonomonadaceae bacterium]|nr:hypothetical protein [Chthonomonadaceae bacterium]
MPEESTNFPITGGYQAISERARSLARTLQAAPAQESRRAAALRRHLIVVAETAALAADRWAGQADTHSLQHLNTCRSLIEQMRNMTAELTYAPPIVPPGIGIVCQAFADKIAPDALLLMRSQHDNQYDVVEHLAQFNQCVQELTLNCSDMPVDLPKWFLTVHYPQGEQENVLLSCLPVHLLFAKRLPADFGLATTAFAAHALGPAFFFALAAWIETLADTNNETYVLAHTRLRFAFDFLKNTGWRDHPQVGKLLTAWQKQVGWTGTEEREPQPGLTGHREWLHNHLPEISGYTPEDFDRDVPRLWERLRQLLPPNDLDINAVESAQPADEVSILNAGWSFYLLHMDDLYHILGSKTAEDRYEAKQVLNRLLTKGIELSQIARRWKEAREK